MSEKDEGEEMKKLFKNYMKNLAEITEEQKAEMEKYRNMPQTERKRQFRIELFVTAEEARNVFALLNGEFEIEEDEQT